MHYEFSYDELSMLESAMLRQVLEAKRALSTHGPYQNEKGRKLLEANVEQAKALRKKLQDYLEQAEVQERNQA